MLSSTENAISSHLIKQFDDLIANASALSLFFEVKSMMDKVSNKYTVSNGFNVRIETMLKQCLSESHLDAYWEAVREFYHSNPVSAIGLIVSFVGGYRSIYNYFGSRTDTAFVPKRYTEVIVAQFIRQCVHIQNEADGEFAVAVVVAQSDRFQKEFIQQLCALEVVSPILLRQLPPDWSVKAASLLLASVPRMLNHKHSSARLLSLLFEKALEVFTVAEVVDEAVIRFNSRQLCGASSKKDYCCTAVAVSDLIVDALPPLTRREVLCVVCPLWSDKAFAFRADPHTQAFLSAVVVRALGSVSADDLMRPGLADAQGGAAVPLAVLLSSGVSNYLDSVDSAPRLLGMRVARAYSAVLGGALDFEELRAEEAAVELKNCTSGGMVPSSSSSVSDGRGGPSGANNAVSTAGDDVDYLSGRELGYGSDSDSDDSEIEAFDLLLDDDADDEEEGAGDSMLRTAYLRDCLDMLRCPEGRPDLKKKHLAALTRVPAIFAEAAGSAGSSGGGARLLPSDAKDLCVPLLKELLILPNAFNLENFDALRSTAIVTLLSALPQLAVPALTAAMVSADTPLGLRINCVAWMSRAAFQIAGTTPGHRVDNDGVLLSGDATGVPAANENSVVRRPAKMAALTRRVVYFRNKFAAVADLFFRPVLQLLTATLDKFAVQVVPSVVLSPTASPALIVDLTAPAVGVEYGGVAAASFPAMTGLDAMLPAQALLGLAAFMQCSANSSDETTYAGAILQVASAYREATELALRRAALGAMLAAVRSAARRSDGTASHRNSGRGVAAAGGGVLGSLTSIAAAAQADFEEDSEGSGGDGAGLSLLGPEERESVVAAASWAMDSLGGDSDAACRAVKRELIGCIANLI